MADQILEGLDAIAAAAGVSPDRARRMIERDQSARVLVGGRWRASSAAVRKAAVRLAAKPTASSLARPMKSFRSCDGRPSSPRLAPFAGRFVCQAEGLYIVR